MSLRNQVSSAIRILRWDRYVSARASHIEAVYGNVPSTTIERKIMSTKTSFKRVALVAAAALALGGFSAVSANAVGGFSDSMTLTNATSSTTPGTGCVNAQTDPNNCGGCDVRCQTGQTCTAGVCG